MSDQPTDNSEPEKTYGQIDINPTAIKSVAHHAVKQSYGIVGMASQGMVNGIAQLLSRDPHKGIDVRLTDDQFEIDLYVIVENGIRIKAVAETLQKSVKFQHRHFHQKHCCVRIGSHFKAVQFPHAEAIAFAELLVTYGNFSLKDKNVNAVAAFFHFISRCH